MARQFGALCPSCGERYASQRREGPNHLDPDGIEAAEIEGRLRQAQSLLTEACWRADQIDALALEGEIPTVLAALENVIAALRTGGNERRMPTDDHND